MRGKKTRQVWQEQPVGITRKFETASSNARRRVRRRAIDRRIEQATPSVAHFNKRHQRGAALRAAGAKAIDAADDVGARGGHFVLEESELGRVAGGDVRRHFGPIGGRGGGLASAIEVARKFGEQSRTLEWRRTSSSRSREGRILRRGR